MSSPGIPEYVAVMDVAEPCVHASGDCHEPVPSKSFSSSGTFAPVSVTALLKFHVRSLPLCTTLTTVIGVAAAARFVPIPIPMPIPRLIICDYLGQIPHPLRRERGEICCGLHVQFSFINREIRVMHRVRT